MSSKMNSFSCDWLWTKYDCFYFFKFSAYLVLNLSHKVVIYYFLHHFVYVLGSCITTYTDLAIYGNDLNGVQGKSSSCCQFCQQKRGCKGWTWENFNGGTCWLKNDTQPLYKASQNGQITGIMSPDVANTYALNLTFDATNFWDQPWHFDQWHSTNVTDKVNETTAKRLEMFGYRNGKVGLSLGLQFKHLLVTRLSASTKIFVFNRYA